MTDLTYEELQLLCMLRASTRKETMESLLALRPLVQMQRAECLPLVDSLLAKLGTMQEYTFRQLDLNPDFEN